MIGTKNKVDWKQIKNEYITNPEISYRSLAEKYSVSQSTVWKRAKKEEWTKKREQFEGKSEAETLEMLKKERAKGEVERMRRAGDCTDKLLKKIETAIGKCSSKDALSIQRLTSSLKDIRDMLGYNLTDADKREQEAKIAKIEESLIYNLPNDSEEKDVLGVVIMPEIKPITPPIEDQKDENNMDAAT